MKTIKKIIFIVVLLVGMMGLTSQKATAQVAVSFQMFYDNLSVHGSWISDPTYGYVWSPSVGAGFAPYRTNGYWVYTDYGWTWVSNYSWGWGPFHYGRWFYDPFYGWLWAPDTVWAPAWVTWRYYDGYYGWAPIAPGISIDIAFGNSYSVPYNQWCFVRERDFGRRNISNYYVNSSNNTTIINNSTVINNVRSGNGGRYNAGPSRDHVQKKTGNAVAEVNIKDRNQPGQSMSRNELQLYKPNVERGNKAAPAKVTSRNEAKATPERKTEARIVRPETNRNAKEERQLQRPKEQQRINEPARQKENLGTKAREKAAQEERDVRRFEQNVNEQEQQIQRVEQRARERENKRIQRQQPTDVQPNAAPARSEIQNQRRELQQRGNNVEKRTPVRQQPERINEPSRQGR
ncbi:hypothetical protein LZZ90_12765 [Flavobacterium sp. SM15]|uniref:DUF6600 domain-containing protein n=1 Tax=Flavobacterium sp. SM15 TaxID=2908005 RepID=UPI001EDAC6B5|nr:DUF6600 domain-containing protein [Flavobacterium sp. SM15]MCG2612380.1 hypothetical protein [Flavobacterium sp. SM15]